VRVESFLYGDDATVIGDATQLHRVVMNLCTNAAQRSRTRRVTLALTARGFGKPRDLSHGRLKSGSYVQSR